MRTTDHAQGVDRTRRGEFHLDGRGATPIVAKGTWALVAAALVVAVILASTAWLRDQPPVTAEEQDAAAPLDPISPQLIVDSIHITGTGTTSRVELVFDSPLADVAINFVDSFRSVDTTDAIAYTTQPASQVNVCDSVHSFPPPADGTVDLLVPASWFAPVDEPNIAPIKQVGQPAKFVTCGPYDGFYQYSIWGPASIDPSRISVKIESGNTLVVSIDP